jgi:hypothetical protein
MTVKTDPLARLEADFPDADAIVGREQTCADAERVNDFDTAGVEV